MKSSTQNEPPRPAEEKAPRNDRKDRPDPASTAEKLDEALDETFPASDPIAVTPTRQDSDNERDPSGH